MVKLPTTSVADPTVEALLESTFLVPWAKSRDESRKDNDGYIMSI
jgi:hypothetical protein